MRLEDWSFSLENNFQPASNELSQIAMIVSLLPLQANAAVEAINWELAALDVQEINGGDTVIVIVTVILYSDTDTVIQWQDTDTAILNVIMPIARLDVM